MAIEDIQRRPERMALTNLETTDSISAQFNPNELKEEITVNYERLEVLGQSFQPMQYKSTSNLQLQFELGFDAVSLRDIVTVSTTASSQDAFELDADSGKGPKAILAARNYIMHLCYPRKGAQDVTGGGPPRVLMYWPNMYSLTCRLTKVTFVHKRWALSMMPVLFTAQIALEEVADARILSEDILQRGTLKGA